MIQLRRLSSSRVESPTAGAATRGAPRGSARRVSVASSERPIVVARDRASRGPSAGWRPGSSPSRCRRSSRRRSGSGSSRRRVGCGIRAARPIGGRPAASPSRSLGLVDRRVFALAPASRPRRRDLLEDRILLQLLLDQVDQLEPGQLQQLDRLLQLRRHHQLLAEPELLFEFDRHRSVGLVRSVQAEVLAQIDLAHRGILGDLRGRSLPDDLAVLDDVGAVADRQASRARCGR